jgi:hypothetical protein
MPQPVGNPAELDHSTSDTERDRRGGQRRVKAAVAGEPAPCLRRRDPGI